MVENAHPVYLQRCIEPKKTKEPEAERFSQEWKWFFYGTALKSTLIFKSVLLVSNQEPLRNSFNQRCSLILYYVRFKSTKFSTLSLECHVSVFVFDFLREGCCFLGFFFFWGAVETISCFCCVMVTEVWWSRPEPHTAHFTLFGEAHAEPLKDLKCFLCSPLLCGSPDPDSSSSTVSVVERRQTCPVPSWGSGIGSQYVSELRIKRRSSSFLIHFRSLVTANMARAFVARGLKQR